MISRAAPAHVGPVGGGDDKVRAVEAVAGPGLHLHTRGHYRFNYVSSIKSYNFSVNYYKSSFNFL